MPASGQGAAGVRASAQQIDEAYSAKIKEYLQDPRITTELVDHLPLSSTVPTPLTFHGHIVGTPGELTYAKDIHRYFEALGKASPRARYWTIGKTEEGRDMVVLAIADSADRHHEVDVLADQWHPLAGNRRSRDAAGARVPTHRRRDALRT